MDAAAKVRFQIMSRVQQKGIRYIELQFTDVEGMVKNVVIPAQELDDSLAKGIWFDGSSIEGFARVAESDMYLLPDPSTFAVLPWQQGKDATARLICDVYTPDGQSFGGDPRAALKRAIAEASGMGLSFITGPEMEFFLLDPGVGGNLIPPVPHDDAGYFDAPSDVVAGLGRQMISTLEAIGIDVEAMHHEVAGGQHEIDFRDADAFATADNIVTFRVALKAIARLKGFYGTFMPKPIAGMSGSGMHVHQGMRFTANGRDAFHDAGDPHGLSSLAKHFIAGQLAHARGMCAILAPLVNSYKRLFAGYEAPVHVSWARINRAALIRVPRATETGNTRVELRCPDPSCNPYLAFAVMLAAGLDGIRRELPLSEANEENPYAAQLPPRSAEEMLPISLNAAVDALEEDEVVCNTLGPYIARRFIEAKRLEWEESHREVTPWELEKYLTRY
ncbi:MAG: type I glutamate--ammonia ligase [Rectinemataceae bacterium]|jgi:glutamine synthetase